MRWSPYGPSWTEFPISPICCNRPEEYFGELRRAEGTGRPLGAPEFVTGLEKVLGCKIARRAPGRKPKNENGSADQLSLL